MDALEALNLAAPVADTYNELEAMLLRHIAEQLAANPDTLVNATSEWRIKMLAQMGRLNRETAKIISDMAGKVPSQVENAVNRAIDKVITENAVSLSKGVSENIAKAVKSFDRQAVINKYNQVNTVMQFKARQAYVNGVNSVADRFERKTQAEIANKQEHLDILNKNALAVTVGEKSRTEAVRETIGQMCDKGIPAFVDASGREWSPEAYVNMDVRNTAKNAALAAQFGIMDELDQDVILISSHSGARPKCAPYQGKLYSRSGKSGTIKDANGKEYSYEPLSSTSFGEPDGIFGINCGHRPRGVTEGAFINREEIYSEKENSEEYEKVCEQRRQERKIRADKTKQQALKAAGDNEGAKELSRKITAEDKQLKAYCQREGLSYRQDRTGVYGYVSHAKAFGDIKKPPKTLTYNANYDTIKPYKIPVSRQEVKDMIKKSNSLSKPIFAIDTENNKFASCVAGVKPEKGKYDVALHGSDTFAEFFGKPIDAYTLAKIIKSRPDYKIGTPVRLLSCNTGNTDNTGNCFAQILANELHTTVYAPNDILYVNSDGSFYVGDFEDGVVKSFIWRE